MAYGLTYFIVHDIFIHQRFKFLKKANNWYARGVRKAHKMHHANIKKDGGEVVTNSDSVSLTTFFLLDIFHSLYFMLFYIINI